MKIPEVQLRMQNLRTLLNMSQLEMAEYLGVGRVLVALCEKKQRKLTGVGLLRFRALTDHLRNVELPTKKELAPIVDPALPELKRQLIRACKAKYIPVKNKLEAKMAELEKLRTARYLIESMVHNESLAKADLKEFKLWKAYRLAAKDNEIMKFNRSEIIKLKAQVIAFEAELAFLEQRL